MKEFFKDCIKKLDTIAGIKKYTYLQINAGKNTEAEIEANKEMDLWISSLVRVSEKFDYIPEDAQKKYILRMMEEDQQYQDFNSRTVWKWLDLHKDKHITHSQFTEEALTQGTPFDQLPQETKDLVNNFLDQLNDRKVKMTPQEIFDQGQERPARAETSYISTTQEDIKIHELKIQYANECTNISTGRLLDGAPDFKNWLKIEMERLKEIEKEEL